MTWVIMFATICSLGYVNSSHCTTERLNPTRHQLDTDPNDRGAGLCLTSVQRTCLADCPPEANPVAASA